MEKLKPCPFCGNDKNFADMGGQLRCQECLAVGPAAFPGINPYQHWNTRSPGKTVMGDEIFEALKLIQGVWFKPLVTHTDERGFFREIIRVTDDLFSEGFGQWSYSRMNPGVVKAFHIHQKQVDWWLVPFGEAKAVLHDCRPDSPTHGLTNEFFMGDGREPFVLKIPPGVAHGIKAITPVYLFYITSRVYDPADEGRIPHDDPGIGYDWLKGPEIK